jgi:hypothetical protein
VRIQPLKRSEPVPEQAVVPEQEPQLVAAVGLTATKRCRLPQSPPMQLEPERALVEAQVPV